MPAARLLGITVRGFGDGVSVVVMPVRHDITFDGRVVQGGIVGTLADFAAVSAAIAAAPVGTFGSTTSFDVHNLAPAAGEQLFGIGRLVKLGRSQAVAAADVYAENKGEATLVATALATCRLFQVP
jgi:uncharacterized protein (TIGR00369 family)